MADHDELISRMVELTGTSADQAQEYLAASDWNFQQAVDNFYVSDGEASDGEQDDEEPSTEPAPSTYTGPRTLDGRPAPQYAGASSSAAKKPQKRTGLATLSSIGGGGHGHGHSHDDDDDDDDDSEDERRGPRDLFAGGEKSGLAVQDPSQRGGSDPRKLINDIVAKAKANAKKPTEDEGSSSAGPSRHFTRGGNVLGGDGVETRRVGEPEAGPAAVGPTGETAFRVLHIWEDGFSIDDGELHRFDDPVNQAALDMIRNGRAPLHLMNVRSDQRVDVKLKEHDEKFRQLPKIYRPFGGEGRRLGSPVPGVPAVAAPPAAAAPTPAAAGGSPQISNTNVDASQPTLMLRIQLPDGTRLPARFNTSQNVGDVYEFITRASPGISARSWVLSTTFPSKDHTDKDLVLGEMNEFKRGGTAVVKWL